MKDIFKDICDALITDEMKQVYSESLNKKKMLMNPRTGTVQSFELWQSENDTDPHERFDKSELVEVKLVNDQWVMVN